MSEKTGIKRKHERNGDSPKSKIKPEPVSVKVEPGPKPTPDTTGVKSEEFSDDDEIPNALVKKEMDPEQSRQCPYLDTIDRNVLDFGKFKL